MFTKHIQIALAEFRQIPKIYWIICYAFLTLLLIFSGGVIGKELATSPKEMLFYTFLCWIGIHCFFILTPYLVSLLAFTLLGETKYKERLSKITK